MVQYRDSKNTVITLLKKEGRALLEKSIIEDGFMKITARRDKKRLICWFSENNPSLSTGFYKAIEFDGDYIRCTDSHGNIHLYSKDLSRSARGYKSIQIDGDYLRCITSNDHQALYSKDLSVSTQLHKSITIKDHLIIASNGLFSFKNHYNRMLDLHT